MSKLSVIFIPGLIIGISLFGDLSLGDDTPKIGDSKDAEAQIGINTQNKECRDKLDKVKAAASECGKDQPTIGNAWKVLSDCSAALNCKVKADPKDTDESDDLKNFETSMGVDSTDKDDIKKAQAAALKRITTNADNITDQQTALTACKDQDGQEQANALNDQAVDDLKDKNSSAKEVSAIQEKIQKAKQEFATEQTRLNADMKKLTADNQAAQAAMENQLRTQDFQATQALDGIRTKLLGLQSQLNIINSGTEYQAAYIDWTQATQLATSKCRDAMTALATANKLTTNLSSALGSASQGGSNPITNFCNSKDTYTSAIIAANQKFALARTRLAEETTGITIQMNDLDTQATRIVQNSKLQGSALATQLATKMTNNDVQRQSDTDELNTAAANLKANTDILDKELADAQQQADDAAKEYANTKGQLDTLKEAGINPTKGKDKRADDFEKRRKTVEDGAQASQQMSMCNDDGTAIVPAAAAK